MTTPARIAAVVVAGVTSAVYVRTLLPGMAFGDWGEMQTVPHVLGIAHPTGYPTYIITAWVAHLVPVGSIAFRANLLSAVLVAAALAVMVAILVRLGTRPAIAAAVALALGVVGTVWFAATVAEVNPLHLLFVALILHRALVWADRRWPRDIAVGGLLLGLGAGNHLLILFVAPFVIAFVLWVGRREIAARPSLVVMAALATVVGLAVYLYIPIAAAASPPLPYNHPATLDAFLFLVRGEQFHAQFGFLSPSGVSELAGSSAFLWRLLGERGTLLVPGLGLIGLLVLCRQRPAFGLMCLGILVTGIYVWANYRRLEHYLLVPWLLLAVGAGVALEAVARRVERAIASRVASTARVWVGRSVAAIAVLFAIVLATTNWRAADRSGDRSAEAFVESTLGALPDGAAILSEWDLSTPLWHARHVLGRRPDVLIVDDTNIVYEGWGSRSRRIASLLCERPVFIIRLRELAEEREAFRLVPVLSVRVAQGGPSAAVTRQLFRIEPAPDSCPGGLGAAGRAQADGTTAAVRGATSMSAISSGASAPSDSATTTASSPDWSTKSGPGLTKA